VCIRRHKIIAFFEDSHDTVVTLQQAFERLGKVGVAFDDKNRFWIQNYIHCFKRPACFEPIINYRSHSFDARQKLGELKINVEITQLDLSQYSVRKLTAVNLFSGGSPIMHGLND
jgi:hypothetical protein